MFELIVIPEPRRAPTADRRQKVQVAWSVQFAIAAEDYREFEAAEREGEANTWEAEAVAYDAGERRFLLLTKPVHERIPAAVWSVPLRALGVAHAKRVCTLADVPRVQNRGRSKLPNDVMVPTAIDGYGTSEFFVLTQRHAYRFVRAVDESWDSVFARVPERIELPPLRQPEALAVHPVRGDLFVTSEQRGAPSPLFVVPRVLGRGGRSR